LSYTISCMLRRNKSIFDGVLSEEMLKFHTIIYNSIYLSRCLDLSSLFLEYSITSIKFKFVPISYSQYKMQCVSENYWWTFSIFEVVTLVSAFLSKLSVIKSIFFLNRRADFQAVEFILLINFSNISRLLVVFQLVIFSMFNKVLRRKNLHHIPSSMFIVLNIQQKLDNVPNKIHHQLH
jgi:hypothetical protein